MLGGYFPLQREVEDMFACLLIRPSERNIGMSMTSSGLQASAFSSFLCDAFKPSHFQFLSDKAATNFSGERSNMKKK